MIKRTFQFLFWLLLFFTFTSFCQELTKDQIQLVLELQGNIDKDAIPPATELLYSRYLDRETFDVPALASAISLSSLSGVSLGFHESYTFGYTNDKWLPGFVQDWYEWRPETDAVFGKTFTFQKVFRDIDYISDRSAWNNWKKVWNVKKFWSWGTLGAFVTHFTVKNTFATFVRDKMKHDDFLYSWQVELFFGTQLVDLFENGL